MVTILMSQRRFRLLSELRVCKRKHASCILQDDDNGAMQTVNAYGSVRASHLPCTYITFKRDLAVQDLSGVKKTSCDVMSLTWDMQIGCPYV